VSAHVKASDLTSPLRRRRALKLVAWIALALVGAASALDHAGAFGRTGFDVAHQFDRHSVTVTNVVDGDSFRIRAPNETDEITIALLGVDAPDLPIDHWSQRAADYVRARLLGRTVTLRIEPTQSRDDRGRVLAYVYITDADVLNADIIRDGQAYADRRARHPYAAQFEQAENEARRKSRGLWKDVTEQTMPAWRRAWLQQWRAEHPR
jgi:endonuclease YncB( thermonuclease family)